MSQVALYIGTLIGFSSELSAIVVRNGGLGSGVVMAVGVIATAGLRMSSDWTSGGIVAGAL